MKSGISVGHKEYGINSFECCQLATCANPGLCFHISNPTYYLFHRAVVPSTLEIRGRDREGNWRCPSYKTRQSLALELGLPPLLCGLEEGNQGTGAKFTLPKTSGILCWSTLEKLSRNSCNSHPLPSPASSIACPGPDMTSITLVSASFLNGTLVLFYQKKLYFVDKENACATRNRNVCVPRQGFPPPKFRLILEHTKSFRNNSSWNVACTGTDCTDAVQIIMLVKQS